MPYVVKATAWGKSNRTITQPSSRKTAQKRADDLRVDMKQSIPRYQWAKNIRVARTKYATNALTQ